LSCLSLSLDIRRVKSPPFSRSFLLPANIFLPTLTFLLWRFSPNFDRDFHGGTSGWDVKLPPQHSPSPRLPGPGHSPPPPVPYLSLGSPIRGLGFSGTVSCWNRPDPLCAIPHSLLEFFSPYNCATSKHLPDHDPSIEYMDYLSLLPPAGFPRNVLSAYFTFPTFLIIRVAFHSPPPTILLKVWSDWDFPLSDHFLFSFVLFPPPS